jgi:hypothetical protein
MGRPLYESLDFRTDFELGRHAGVSAPPARHSSQNAISVPITPPDLDQVARVDQECTGTYRRRLLERLLRERPESGRMLVRGSRVTAFALARAGFHGTLIGPCFGRDPDTGRLLREALASLPGEKVLVDIPTMHDASLQCAAASQLAFQRPLWRMTRGPRVPEDPLAIWASGGPEKG